MEPQLWGEATG